MNKMPEYLDKDIDDASDEYGLFKTTDGTEVCFKYDNVLLFYRTEKTENEEDPHQRPGIKVFFNTKEHETSEIDISMEELCKHFNKAVLMFECVNEPAATMLAVPVDNIASILRDKDDTRSYLYLERSSERTDKYYYIVDTPAQVHERITNSLKQYNI